mmetsp:Transcript_5183/g.11498  ORF Transcript_5183/g.11498 Transcript_5183/m.11498 type:complete len:239 (+) Transcript_5183:1313-2029(+)
MIQNLYNLPFFSHQFLFMSLFTDDSMLHSNPISIDFSGWFPFVPTLFCVLICLLQGRFLLSRSPMCVCAVHSHQFLSLLFGNTNGHQKVVPPFPLSCIHNKRPRRNFGKVFVGCNLEGIIVARLVPILLTEVGSVGCLLSVDCGTLYNTVALAIRHRNFAHVIRSAVDHNGIHRFVAREIKTKTQLLSVHGQVFHDVSNNTFLVRQLLLAFGQYFFEGFSGPTVVREQLVRVNVLHEI